MKGIKSLRMSVQKGFLPKVLITLLVGLAIISLASGFAILVTQASKVEHFVVRDAWFANESGVLGFQTTTPIRYSDGNIEPVIPDHIAQEDEFIPVIRFIVNFSAVGGFIADRPVDVSLRAAPVAEIKNETSIKFIMDECNQHPSRFVKGMPISGVVDLDRIFRYEELLFEKTMSCEFTQAGLYGGKLRLVTTTPIAISSGKYNTTIILSDELEGRHFTDIPVSGLIEIASAQEWINVRNARIGQSIGWMLLGFAILTPTTPFLRNLFTPRKTNQYRVT